MALIDALIEIVEEMEKDSSDPSMQNTLGGQFIRSYAKQIRRSIKASEDIKPKFEIPTWEKEAREEFKNKKKISNQMIDVLEKFEGAQVEIVDGPLGSSDGTPNFWSVPSGGKPGACKAVIDDKYVYRLGTDNKLYFAEEETKKMEEVKRSMLGSKELDGGVLLG